MPGKSGRGKGKFSGQGKKRRRKPSRSAMPGQQPAVAQAREPVSSPDVSTPLATMPTSRAARQAAVSTLHVATELRIIGILAGILLVALIVLALLLS